MVQAFKEPSAVITPKIIPPTDLRSTN